MDAFAFWPQNFRRWQGPTMILLLLYECSGALAVKKNWNSCTHRQWECKTLDRSACTLALAPNRPPGGISTA